MSEAHVLKIKEQFADDICSGRKTFEVRREDDKHFAAGDKIVFEVVDEQGEIACTHDLNLRLYDVEDVLRGGGVREGYAVLAIRKAFDWMAVEMWLIAIIAGEAFLWFMTGLVHLSAEF